MASSLSGNGGAKDGGEDQEDICRGLRAGIERAVSSGSMPTPTATPLLVQLKGAYNLSRKKCPSNFAYPSPASDSSFSGAGGGGASVSPCAASTREMENSSRPNAVSKPPDTLSRPSPGPSGPGEAPKAAGAGRASPSGTGNKQSSATTPAKRKRKRKSNRPETTTIIAENAEDFKALVQENTGLQNGIALASQSVPVERICSATPRLQLALKDIAAPSTAGSNRPAATLTATASNPPPPAKEPTFSADPPCYGGVNDSPCYNMNDVMGFGNSVPNFLQDPDPDMDHNTGKSASELLRPVEHPLSNPYADRTSKPKWPEDIQDIREGYLSPERSHASAGGGWAPEACYEEDDPYNPHTLQLVDDWLLFPSLDDSPGMS